MSESNSPRQYRSEWAVVVIVATLLAVLASFLPSWRWVPTLSVILVYGAAYAFLLRVPNEGVVTLTATHLFAAIYTLYIAIPALLAFLLIHTPVVGGPPDLPVGRILVFSLLGFLALVAGSLCGYFLVRAHRPSLLPRYRERALECRLDINAWFPLFVVTALGIAGTVFFFWSHRRDYLALLVAQQIGGQRSELRAGSGYLTMNFVYILPWMCVLTYLAGRARGQRRMLIVALLIGGSAFLAQAALLYRGNIVFFFILLLVASQAVQMKVSADIVKWSVPAIVFFVAATAVRLGTGAGTDHLLQSVGTKILARFITPIRQLGYILDTFPRHGFFPGKTYLLDVSALLPGAQRSFNGIIYQEMGGAGFGSATITILGESYANFGGAGIVLVPFVIGALLQLMHHRLLRSRKTAVGVLLYSLLTVYSAKAVLAGLTANLLQPVGVFLAFALPTLVVAHVLRMSAFGRGAGTGSHPLPQQRST